MAKRHKNRVKPLQGRLQQAPCLTCNRLLSYPGSKLGFKLLCQHLINDLPEAFQIVSESGTDSSKTLNLGRQALGFEVVLGSRGNVHTEELAKTILQLFLEVT